MVTRSQGECAAGGTRGVSAGGFRHRRKHGKWGAPLDLIAPSFGDEVTAEAIGINRLTAWGTLPTPGLSPTRYHTLDSLYVPSKHRSDTNRMDEDCTRNGILATI
jgi:hypothetical protein